MDEKTLIIKKNGNDLFFYKFSNVYSFFKCKESNYIFKLFRKLNLPLNIFFDDWKKKLKQIDKVILFDNGYNLHISKYIKKKNPNIKTIFWYWNSLAEYNNTVIKDENIDEIWTYNRFEAEKYNLKYNMQFYHSIMDTSNSDVNENKAIFLGRNKGRETEIFKVKRFLEENNVICQFDIVVGKKIVPYQEYLNNMNKCNIIVDISAFEKSGLSLRPLEALFYHKKLITSNTDIVNYDFYNSNNIFVWGVDKDIKAFLEKPYEQINQTIIDYYDFENWIERF